MPHLRPRAPLYAGCMDVFDDIEKVKSEFDWDGALTEVLQTISAETNAPSE